MRRDGRTLSIVIITVVLVLGLAIPAVAATGVADQARDWVGQCLGLGGPDGAACPGPGAAGGAGCVGAGGANAVPGATAAPGATDAPSGGGCCGGGPAAVGSSI